MKCPNCGKRIEDGAGYCPNCGFEFVDQDARPAFYDRIHMIVTGLRYLFAAFIIIGAGAAVASSLGWVVMIAFGITLIPGFLLRMGINELWMRVAIPFALLLLAAFVMGMGW